PVDPSAEGPFGILMQTVRCSQVIGPLLERSIPIFSLILEDSASSRFKYCSKVRVRILEILIFITGLGFKQSTLKNLSSTVGLRDVRSSSRDSMISAFGFGVELQVLFPAPKAGPKMFSPKIKTTK